jgi:hypothetical protein
LCSQIRPARSRLNASWSSSGADDTPRRGTTVCREFVGSFAFDNGAQVRPAAGITTKEARDEGLKIAWRRQERQPATIGRRLTGGWVPCFARQKAHE